MSKFWAIGATLIGFGVSAISMPAEADVLCKNKKGAVSARSACKGKETAIDLGSVGLVGPKGDKGDPGPAGSGARWALVKYDGAILAQSGGISVTTDLTCPNGSCSCAGSGPCNALYYVDFGNSQTNKAIQATATSVSSACTTTGNCGSTGAMVATLCGGGPTGTTCEGSGINDTSHVAVFASNPSGGSVCWRTFLFRPTRASSSTPSRRRSPL